MELERLDESSKDSAVTAIEGMVFTCVQATVSMESKVDKNQEEA